MTFTDTVRNLRRPPSKRRTEDDDYPGASNAEDRPTLEDEIADTIRSAHPRDLDEREESVYGYGAGGGGSAEGFTIETPAKLPDYVQHADNVDPVGRLTAEAIVKQHEETARAMEQMGEGIKEWSAHLERLLQMNDAALKHVERTVQAVRDEAKRQFERVEQHSNLSTEVREKCDEMVKKLALAVT